MPCPAGGHKMEQQKTTTQHLWQLVKPGGIFVMEVSLEFLMAAVQSVLFCAFTRQESFITFKMCKSDYRI